MNFEVILTRIEIYYSGLQDTANHYKKGIIVTIDKLLSNLNNAFYNWICENVEAEKTLSAKSSIRKGFYMLKDVSHVCKIQMIVCLVSSLTWIILITHIVRQTRVILNKHNLEE